MEDFGGRQFLNPTEVIELTGVGEGDKVGDLGCGSGGYFTVPFAQKVGASGIVYAVDVLPEALASVASNVKSYNLTNVVPVWSNLEIPRATKIPIGGLDYGFMITMLYQNKDRQAILEEATRLIKRGGKLVIVDWKQEKTIIGPAQNLRLDPDSIRNSVIALGYEEMLTTDIGDHHFLMMFKKI